MGRVETHRVKIRGQGGRAHRALGISSNSRKLECRDGDTEKMPRVEIEFGASFHEP